MEPEPSKADIMAMIISLNDKMMTNMDKLTDRIDRMTNMFETSYPVKPIRREYPPDDEVAHHISFFIIIVYRHFQ